MNARSLGRQPHAVLDLSSHDWKAVKIEGLPGNTPDAPMMPLLRIISALIYRCDTKSA